MTTPPTTPDAHPSNDTANGVTVMRIHHPSTMDQPTVDEAVTTDTPQPTRHGQGGRGQAAAQDTHLAIDHHRTAAAVAVWSGWVGLGQMAGFGFIQPLPGIWDDLRVNTAFVLPLSVEAYAAYALRVWVSTKSNDPNDRTTKFARRSAIASMIIGAVAQVAYHLMSAAGYTHAPWFVVILVATVPVLVLGLASALAKLVTTAHAEDQS